MYSRISASIILANLIQRQHRRAGIVTYGGYLAGCVISLLVHESGHVCAALAMGIRVKRIGVSWWGPYIVREAGPLTANAIISAAGPMINLAAAVIAWQHFPGVAMANLVLGLSNLYPTPTSDGRRVLAGLSVAWNRRCKPKTPSSSWGSEPA